MTPFDIKVPHLKCDKVLVGSYHHLIAWMNPPKTNKNNIKTNALMSRLTVCELSYLSSILVSTPFKSMLKFTYDLLLSFG